MCLAMPGKIVEIEGKDSLGPRAKVDFGGVLKEVSLACLTDVKVGDYVIVHVGIALSKLDEEEAARTLELFSEMAELEQQDEKQPK
jgi:hydrogenase expression/formation protein HypC